MTTKIEWTDCTINPFPGCKKVSPGCANCYAEKMAYRLKAMGHAAYQDVVDEKGWTGKVGCNLGAMKVPGKGKMVFCESMGDLFYEGISYDEWAEVWRYMDIAEQHTYQVLTKRPERAKDYVGHWMQEMHPITHNPPENIWLGTTCENQEWADKRIPILLQIPAEVRFISVEPMLGPVDLLFLHDPGITRRRNALTGYYDNSPYDEGIGPTVDWVVVGCESGPGRRECKPEWIQSIVDQCIAAGVPVFVKAIEVNGEITKDINRISNILGYPAESLRQWPSVSSVAKQSLQGPKGRTRANTDAHGPTTDNRLPTTIPNAAPRQ